MRVHNFSCFTTPLPASVFKGILVLPELAARLPNYPELSTASF